LSKGVIGVSIENPQGTDPSNPNSFSLLMHIIPNSLMPPLQTMIADHGSRMSSLIREYAV
jgi:hypothetical protein